MFSYFDSLIYMCKYQSWFRVNQRWISAVYRWKSNVSELRKSALNSADSELFLWSSAVQLWDSAEFFSFEQPWFRENQNWSALTNVKTMKQRCSALITTGTSTRVKRAEEDDIMATSNNKHQTVRRVSVSFVTDEYYLGTFQLTSKFRPYLIMGKNNPLEVNVFFMFLPIDTVRCEIVGCSPVLTAKSF